MAKVLKDRGVRSPMHIIPTGLDLVLFRDADGGRFRRKYGIRPAGLLLLFVGRVAPEKNVEFLIRMLSKVVVNFPEVMLVITGRGQDMEKCQNLVSALDLTRNVLLVGWLDRETELLDCYDAADVFVFASRTETQGLALLEALALGVPVVSTSHLGSVDTVQSGQGAIVAPEDETIFAREVSKLLSSPKRRVALGKEAREYAENRLVGPMVKGLSRVYKETDSSTETLYGLFRARLWEGLIVFLIVYYIFQEKVLGQWDDPHP